MNKDKNVLIIMLFFLFSIIIWPNLSLAQSVADCEEDMSIEDCLQLQRETNTSDDNMTKSNVNSQGSLVANLFKMVFALLLTLGLIYALVKLLGRKNRSLQQSNILENLGGIPLGHNKSIQIVRIGSQVLVVGVGDNIGLLYEIKDKAIIELIEESNQSSESNVKFIEYIKDRFHKSEQKNETESSNEFEHLFTKELHKMKENRKQIIEEHKKREDHYE